MILLYVGIGAAVIIAYLIAGAYYYLAIDDDFGGWLAMVTDSRHGIPILMTLGVVLMLIVYWPRMAYLHYFPPPPPPPPPPQPPLPPQFAKQPAVQSV